MQREEATIRNICPEKAPKHVLIIPAVDPLLSTWAAVADICLLNHMEHSTGITKGVIFSCD